MHKKIRHGKYSPSGYTVFFKTFTNFGVIFNSSLILSNIPSPFHHFLLCRRKFIATHMCTAFSLAHKHLFILFYYRNETSTIKTAQNRKYYFKKNYFALSSFQKNFICTFFLFLTYEICNHISLYANIDALSVALNIIESRKIKEIICLGDIMIRRKP